MQFVQVVNDSIEYRRFGETIRIEPWGPDSLRVRASLGSQFTEHTSVLLPPQSVKPHIVNQDDQAVITNGRARATIDAAGRIRFSDAVTGNALLEEPVFSRDFSHAPLSRQYDNRQGNLYRITARFLARQGERLYGMGQRPHGMLDQKGCVLELAQRNTQVNIPFLLSSEGYGLIWNMPSYGRAELARNHTHFIADAAQQLDYVIIAGQTPRDILCTYTGITGRSPMIPEWAMGFWQCKLRYRTQEELLTVARRYKQLGLPLSVIVIDFYHWTAQGEWQFDPQHWPDPRAMVRELDDMGIKLVVSMWPTVGSWAETFRQMADEGMLLLTDIGTTGLCVFGDSRRPQAGPVAFYDPTNPKARQFVWDRLRQGYGRYGIEAFWLDACEPEMVPFQPHNVRCHLGPISEVGGLYPLYNQQMFFEGLKQDGCNDVLTLCRSAWLGSQRYGAAVWNGDIHSNWPHFKASIRAGLNMMLSGIAWWTTDIGGFVGANIHDPAFHELLVRWFEYGVFCPLFRLHGVRDPQIPDPNGCVGTGADNEVWSYGPEVYSKVAPLLFLRERLRPYIRRQMQLIHETGVPIMRPMFYEFPDDSGCAAIEDQFMFGPDLLVAPVTDAGAAERSVYLPAGCTWTHAWTGKSYAGGQQVTVASPLGRGPVFIRDGGTEVREGRLDVKLFANLDCPPYPQATA